MRAYGIGVVAVVVLIGLAAAASFGWPIAAVAGYVLAAVFFGAVLLSGWQGVKERRRR